MCDTTSGIGEGFISPIRSISSGGRGVISGRYSGSLRLGLGCNRIELLAVSSKMGIASPTSLNEKKKSIATELCLLCVSLLPT